jgi:transposase-like protein
MARKKISEKTLLRIYNHKNGESVLNLCKKYGVSDATYYLWRKKHLNNGESSWFQVAPPLITDETETEVKSTESPLYIELRKQLRELEEENRLLKDMLVNALLQGRRALESPTLSQVAGEWDDTD